jgi:hypothetical protein
MKLFSMQIIHARYVGLVAEMVASESHKGVNPRWGGGVVI